MPILNSITKKWVRGSLLFTLLVLLLAEGIFVYFTFSSNYDAVYNTLQTRMETLLVQLNASDMQNVDNRGVILRRMVEQFPDKDKFELSLVTKNGSVTVSSLGYVSKSNAVPQEDFFNARSTGDIGQAVYSTDSDERVMAMTMMLPLNAGEFTAFRMVTSLTLVDENIFTYVIVSFMFVLTIFMFSTLSGSFFIRSIVHPILEIEKTASKIAKGNFNIRIKTEYNTSEMQRLVATINNMAGELETTERMKNDFISSVSHELRTPLTSIKGWAETLSTADTQQSELQSRGLKVIYSETDRLYDMVEELLDFSRLQNGLTLDLHNIDLVAEVSDSVLTVQQRVHNGGMSISYDEPDFLIPVYADAPRLRQMFINILDNAIKYSQKGDTITITVHCDDSKAYVVIKDEGRGITPEDLEYVKVKFFKGKGSVRGNGIGLAVVDEIARAHGGEIDIDSEYGKGTVVSLYLPLHKKLN